MPWHISWINKAILNFICFWWTSKKLSVRNTEKRRKYSFVVYLNHTRNVLQSAGFCVYGEEVVPSQKLLWTFEELTICLSLNLLHCPVLQHWAPNYSLQIIEVSAIHLHCCPLSLLWKWHSTALTDHHGLLICILCLLVWSHVQQYNSTDLSFLMRAIACCLHAWFMPSVRGEQSRKSHFKNVCIISSGSNSHLKQSQFLLCILVPMICAMDIQTIIIRLDSFLYHKSVHTPTSATITLLL